MTEHEREAFEQQFREQPWAMDVSEDVAWEIWQAARAQQPVEGRDSVGFIPSSGLNNLKAGHPARIYPVGSTPSPFDPATPIYTHPSASVAEKRFPVGGLDHGWRGKYNEGWNDCIDAMGAANPPAEGSE